MDISIKLSMENWNLVLEQLSEGSVRKYMPVINLIISQAREQQGVAAQDNPNGTPPEQQ